MAIRAAVHSAKSLKDTHHDLVSFRTSVDDQFNAWFAVFQAAARKFYGQLHALKAATSDAHRFEMLVELKTLNESTHTALHTKIHGEVTADVLSDVQISTLLNVNRELYLSSQSLLSALADALLDAHGAADYEAIPVST